jgi:hypothetical protein
MGGQSRLRGSEAPWFPRCREECARLEICQWGSETKQRQCRGATHRTANQTPPQGGREFHTSNMRRDGLNTASERSRQHKDRGEQNLRLSHKDSAQPDSGKGNPAENPKLPSQQQTSSPSQRRSISTTRYRQSDQPSTDRVQNRAAKKAEESAKIAHQSMSKEEPYGSEKQLRYGGRVSFATENDADDPGSGPGAGGRKT